MRHGAKIPQIELELGLRGPKQMPARIIKPRLERMVGLPRDHVPRLFAPLLAAENRACGAPTGTGYPAGLKNAIATFMRITPAYRGVPETGLDQGGIRLGACGGWRRAREALGEKAKSEQRQGGREAPRRAMRHEMCRVHPLLFDWAS